MLHMLNQCSTTELHLNISDLSPPWFSVCKSYVSIGIYPFPVGCLCNCS